MGVLAVVITLSLKRTENIVPFGTAELTVTSPPIASVKWRTIARPNPVLPLSRERPYQLDKIVRIVFPDVSTVSLFHYLLSLQPPRS